MTVHSHAVELRDNRVMINYKLQYLVSLGVSLLTSLNLHYNKCKYRETSMFEHGIKMINLHWQRELFMVYSFPVFYLPWGLM